MGFNIFRHNSEVLTAIENIQLFQWRILDFSDGWGAPASKMGLKKPIIFVRQLKKKEKKVQGGHDPSSTIKITKTRQHSSSMYTSHVETVNV